MPLSPPALVALPGGDFLMGCARGRADERPPHPVRLAPFRAAPVPVSNADYRRYLEAGAAPPPPFAHDPRFNLPAQPVVGVSWLEAQAYCRWLAQRSGLPLRLPTEAEREYAARGGLHGLDWPWGDAPPERRPALTELRTLDRPHPPRSACANAYGLRCLADNVHEWCSDWYAADYYAAAPPDNAAGPPSGPPAGRRRASRGGSWRHAVKFTRVSARSSLDPHYRYNDYGFRLYADA